MSAKLSAQPFLKFSKITSTVSRDRWKDSSRDRGVERAGLASSGALPENVNYAIKSSYLLSFLESVPEVAAKLKEPNAKESRFEEVVKETEQAAVLVLVY